MINYDPISIKRIGTMHPLYREKLLKQYKLLCGLFPDYIRPRITCVYRTAAEQTALFTSGKGVTKAKAWQSYHNYGLAFDIVVLIDKDRNGTFETANYNINLDYDKNGKKEWLECVNFFKADGWSWGGDWVKLKDSPHFQASPVLGFKTLENKVKTGNCVQEKIDGKIYVYPNL